MTRRLTPIEADRRFTRGVLAIALAGGAACWAIVGTIWGAAGLWTLLGIVVLVMAATARAVGAGDP